ILAPRVDRPPPGADRFAGVAHETNEEMYIVQGKQAKAEDLVRGEEMPDVRARESAARRAVALLVERPLVEAELGPLDVEPAVAREGRAVAPHPRGGDAIEEVDAAAHALDEVFRKA